ncbi:Glycosyltransferase, GT2 family [Prosthecobacter debontii]|uniref:Glycosyltransferase, GT2 family n=1 Tax=Prosthecobacter debontii TaxID=48467 RepID=A0A1T4XU31_9BACT|nr:glycosyltransferase family A protein [Prosthecobacter debontii]SKA93062.1 Glycosyltransferase, GT2 family [Prosthecobacter debontii]
MRSIFSPSRLSVGVLIRFANSAETLPAVLAALKNQTLPPDVILGVANQSTDGSADLLTEAGACIVEWKEAYEHSRVLNYGLHYLTTDLVLILSSHTVLNSPEAIAQMVACFQDERVACVSACWDSDPYYSDAVTWDELKRRGLRFGSIYSNSMGMIRRSLWRQKAFDEKLPTAEDYDWAISQLQKGKICRRLNLPFSYRRSGNVRDAEFAQIVFQFARKYRLKVAWLGVVGSLKHLLKRPSSEDTRAVKERLKAWRTHIWLQVTHHHAT